MPQLDHLSHIFKAYDIRGKVGTELSADLAKKVGTAFSLWLPTKNKPVIVGRDMRPDSKELTDGLIAGIVATGRNVIDIGMVTSDMAVFAINHLDASGAAIVTASHNPGEYNGIKLYDDTPQTIGLEQGLSAIRDQVISRESSKPKQTPGTVTEQTIIDEWVDYCLTYIDLSSLSPMHIAIDAGNGMAGEILPTVLKKLPFTVEEMYFNPDGTFPNHQANPQNLETLRDLQLKIKEKNCQLGIAFDGDGDRMAMIDETGRPISGSEMMSLLAQKFVREEATPKMVYEVRTSKSLVKKLEVKGFKTLCSKAGRSHIGSLMRKHQAVFGGETSGHFFYKKYDYNDSGMISMLIALEQMCLGGNPVSTIIANNHSTDHMISETNFEVDQPDQVIDEIASHYSQYDQDRLDGLTVNGDTWWLNIRKSNTEPLIRLNAEAQQQTDLATIVDTISTIAQS